MRRWAGVSAVSPLGSCAAPEVLRTPGASYLPTMAFRDTPRACGPWRAHNSVHISVHLQVDTNMDRVYLVFSGEGEALSPIHAPSPGPGKSVAYFYYKMSISSD